MDRGSGEFQPEPRLFLSAAGDASAMETVNPASPESVAWLPHRLGKGDLDRGLCRDGTGPVYYAMPSYAPASGWKLDHG